MVSFASFVAYGSRINWIMLGAFGVVSLVREKVTGNLYAMKQVKIIV